MFLYYIGEKVRDREKKKLLKFVWEFVLVFFFKLTYISFNFFLTLAYHLFFGSRPFCPCPSATW